MDGYEALIESKSAHEAPVVETPPVAESAPAPTPVVETPVTSEAPVVETPAAATPVSPPEHSVPLNVLLRTREEFGGKLSAAEQRAVAAERQLADIRRKQDEAAAEMPHPLDDPDRFAQWLLQKQQTAVQREIGSLSSRHQQQVEVISKNMMQRHLGPEKFGELDKFIQAAPDQAHAIAMKQADPYGWFYEKFEQAQKARKAEEAAKQIEQLGGKSIEEIVAERVAAELAKQTQAATAAVTPVTDARQRNPDGTFAPSPQPARHEPPSLSVVAAATAPRGEDARGGYDALFKRG